MRRITFAIVFAIAAAAYVPTACRTIGFVDRGEFAAVAATLGIAHPTGYPTITLLGHAVVRLSPLRPVVALNLLAALLAAAGVAFLALAFERAIARLEPPRAAGDDRSPAARAALAGTAALLTATTTVVWKQANGFEVYSFHLALAGFVWWRFLCWLDAIDAARESGAGGAGRAGAVFALALGVSFTNHLMTGLLAPGLLAAYFATERRWPRAVLDLLPMVPWFVLGLTPYLYLPLRSVAHPALDWGAPETLPRLWAHVTGAEYRGWLAPGIETFRRQTDWFVAIVPRDWAWLGLGLALLGLGRAARRQARVAWMALLLIVVCVAFAGCYAIREIPPYYLTAVLGIGLLVAAGLSALADRVGTRLALAFGVALVLANGALHLRECDESGNVVVEQHVHDLLDPLPRGAVLFTREWDYGFSASWYFQRVERVRPDVCLLSPDLLRRSWYVNALDRNAPALAHACVAERRRFVGAARALEVGRFRDTTEVAYAYTEMMSALLAAARARGRVFATPEIPPRFAPELARVPRGLVVELTADSAYAPQPLPRYRMRPWPGRVDAYTATLCWLYGASMATRAIYEEHWGHPERARAWRKAALAFDPRIARDRPPVAPYDGPELIAQCARLFEALRASLAQPAGP